MCRCGSFETLMMFTTTISPSSMCMTSSGVIVPIVWLYIMVVLVMILFSIIVIFIYSFVACLCWFVYDRIGRLLGLMRLVLFCWVVRIFRLMPVFLCK